MCNKTQLKMDCFDLTEGIVFLVFKPEDTHWYTAIQQRLKLPICFEISIETYVYVLQGSALSVSIQFALPVQSTFH